MKEEIWNDIPSFEGYYQYSTLLRIKSIDRISNHKLNKKKKITGRVLKIILPFRNGKKDYARISLSMKGVVKTICVHRLFAEMFIPNPENKKYVNHRNGDKHDYSLNNLEWVTKSEDLQHAYDTGLKLVKSGVSNPLYGRPNGNKHSAKRVLDVNSGRYYESCLDAANSCGINPSTMSRYLSGIRKNKTSMIYV